MRRQTDHLVHVLFADTGVLTPPVRVEAVAAQLGVDAIREDDLLEDGRLVQRGDRTTILIRRGLSSGRRRFTIAHEIAHLLILDSRADAIRRRRRGTQDQTERLCDEIAAALLLPYDWVSERFGKKPQTLATLRETSGAADVSLAAAVLRLQEVARWRRALIRFRYFEGRWRYASGAGVPFALHRCLRINGSTRAVLNARSHDRDDATTLLPLVVRGDRQLVHAEISVDRASAIALVDLPR